MKILPSDHIFLAQCELVKRESHDPERQVGAIIVSPMGQILATGSNMPPEKMNMSVSGSHQAIEADPQWKYFVLEHAERNAINKAHALGHKLVDSTMYGTLFPCADCARAIVAAGITRLVVPTPATEFQRNDKWQIHFHYSYQIFRIARVQVDFVGLGIELGNHVNPLQT